MIERMDTVCLKVHDVAAQVFGTKKFSVLKSLIKVMAIAC